MSKRTAKDESSEEDESSDEEQPQQQKAPIVKAKPAPAPAESDEESEGDSDSDEEEEKEKKKPPPKKKAPPPKKRKTAKKKKKDPAAPKKPGTAYMFYSKDQRILLQEKHPGIKFGDLSKKISASWKELTDEDKKPYVRQHEEDKERYNSEMENYQEPSASESSSESDNSSDDDDTKKKKKPVKKKKKEKDPDLPKAKTNAYMYFQKDQRETIKKDNPGLKSVPDIAKKIGAIWRSMTDEQKRPYTDQSEKDKERFEREMEEYKKKKSD